MQAARLRAAGKKRTYGCITLLKPTSTKSAAPREAEAEVPLPVNDCTGAEDGSWYATRLMQCEIDPNVKYTDADADADGKVLGTALFAVAQQLDFSRSSLERTETDQIPAVQISWTTNRSAT